MKHRPQFQSNITIKEAFLKASSCLEESQSGQDPKRVTEWLLLHILEWDRTSLFFRWEETFPEEKLAVLEQLLQRKLQGEPIQYIIGQQDFMGLSFKVNSHVLIPRPETELLVEAVMDQARVLFPAELPLLADICTGSGAIAVAIAARYPDWSYVATDISMEALHIAKENALIHQVDSRISFLQGDMLEPLKSLNRSVDIVVSNPPYIASHELSELQREVGHYEPSIALDGGADGYLFYREMIDELALWSSPPRLIGFEVGEAQASYVAELIRAKKQWEHIRIIEDLSSIPRHVMAY